MPDPWHTSVIMMNPNLYDQTANQAAVLASLALVARRRTTAFTGNLKA